MRNMTDFVILVDEKNQQVGIEEKIKAHELALLHRAFSVFVFNEKGELLLQQRHFEKYHCPWLWSNTTCSHPRPWEDTEQAAHRRLQEEMWFDCELEQIGNILYTLPFNNWLTEHEYDTIFVWKVESARMSIDAANVILNDTILMHDVEKKILPHALEVADYKWISLSDLHKDSKENPHMYTPWLLLIIEKYFRE